MRVAACGVLANSEPPLPRGCGPRDFVEVATLSLEIFASDARAGPPPAAAEGLSREQLPAGSVSEQNMSIFSNKIILWFH